jgi:hypothetical protein
MSQPNILELAKQGDPQAIATLMNRALQPQGMMARVARQGDRLLVALETNEIPNRLMLTNFVRNGLEGLKLAAVNRVRIVARQSDEDQPSWVQELDLAGSSEQSHSQAPVPAQSADSEAQVRPVPPPTRLSSMYSSEDEATSDSTTSEPKADVRRPLPPPPPPLRNRDVPPPLGVGRATASDQDSLVDVPSGFEDTTIMPGFSEAFRRSEQSPASVPEDVTDEVLDEQLVNELLEESLANFEPEVVTLLEPEEEISLELDEYDGVSPVTAHSPEVEAPHSDLEHPAELANCEEPELDFPSYVEVRPDQSGYPQDEASDRWGMMAETRGEFPEDPALSNQWDERLEAVMAADLLAIENTTDAVAPSSTVEEEVVTQPPPPPPKGLPGLPRRSRASVTPPPPPPITTPPIEAETEPSTKPSSGISLQPITLVVLIILCGWIGAIAGYAFFQRQSNSQSPSTATNPIVSPSVAVPTAPSTAPASTSAIEQAAAKASSATTLAQSAQSKDDWEIVITQWQEAITLLKSIPQTSPDYAAAQQQLQSYQASLDSAQQQLAAQPPVTNFPPPSTTVRVSSDVSCRPVPNQDGSPPIEITNVQFNPGASDTGITYIVGCITNHTDQPIGTVSVVYEEVGGADGQPQNKSGSLSFTDLLPGETIPFRSDFTIAPSVSSATIQSILWAPNGASTSQALEASIELTR